MNKRGVTVQATIISIIILIITAGILFYFFKYLPYKEMIDKEACHQSVLLRSQAIAGLKPGQFLIPLNCKTQEIEISSTNEEFIKQEIANAMYDCWWMLGEGKMDFFSESRAVNFGVYKVKSNCIICSTIKFDEKLKQKNMKINIAEYLANTKIPKKNITYLEYFSEETEALDPVVFKDAPLIETSKDYTITFIRIKSPELWRPLVNDLKILVGGTAASAFIFGRTATGSLIKKALGTTIVKTPLITAETPAAVLETGGTVAKTALKGAGVWTLIILATTAVAQTTVTAMNQHIAATHCDGAKEGCFSIVLTPLTAEDISLVCGHIESIP